MAELLQQKEGLLGEDAPAPASLKASPSDDGASASASASVMNSLLGEDASAVERLSGDGVSVVKKGKVLVFDTETTGLPKPSASEKKLLDDVAKDIDWENVDVGIDPKTKTRISGLQLIERFPNLIQFSYVLYDLDTHEYSMYNKYVLDFQEDADALLSNPGTHETIKGALEKRNANPSLMDTRLQIINDFVGMLKANPGITLVGHNVAFDYRMMLAEAYRLGIEQDSKVYYAEVADLMGSFKIHCTCKSLNNIGAKIFSQKKEWNSDVKQYVPVLSNGQPVMEPRGFVALDKLHQKLFGYVPEDLHDSLTDSIVTLRCYYRLMNPNPETGVAFCGPGTPDIYLIAGETKTPELETIQSHIERITPDESKMDLESKAPAPECTDTVLGGNRKKTRRKKQKSRRKKYTSRRRR